MTFNNLLPLYASRNGFNNQYVFLCSINVLVHVFHVGNVHNFVKINLRQFV